MKSKPETNIRRRNQSRQEKAEEEKPKLARYTDSEECCALLGLRLLLNLVLALLLPQSRDRSFALHILNDHPVHGLLIFYLSTSLHSSSIQSANVSSPTF
ncbi:hypothetical protein AAC387_Pa12g0693 [Persea americana]